ncbi:MAG TPA: phosphoribosyl-AMP cyclohydrolase [Dehalococcoidia bacterium]|jgi:phosphoribosyl-AMP cyclohydrolase|nr:phosphoribosyl-AMP cyclohydrolase [Dehalococcoidia bacterium]
MLNYNERGLIPAIVQDATNGQVLMLGYVNQESMRLTLRDGEVWFYSRSRQELWHKGETSGGILKVRQILKDCDQDAILFRVEVEGAVCHTGHRSCFYRELSAEDVA